MDFNFLGFVNRVLMMAKQTYISSVTGQTVGSDAYNVMTCVNDTIRDLTTILRTTTRIVEFSFRTVAGQRVYGLPKRIQYPIISLSQKTSDQKLQLVESAEFDRYVPNDTTSGTPEIYYFDRYSALCRELDSFSGLYYIPTDHILLTPDSTSGTINIQGWVLYNRDTGDLDFMSESINLISYTSQSTSNYYSYVDSITKDSSLGQVSFFSESTNKYVGSLGTNERTSRYALIGLHPIPNAEIIIYGRGYLNFIDLVNDYDVPMGMTPDYINAIVLGSFARYLRYDTTQKNEGLANAVALYDKEINKLLTRDAKNPDAFRRMKTSYETGFKTNIYNPLDRSTP
jgi:hypothetical protein